MTNVMSPIRWTTTAESQFFERKSAREGTDHHRKRRDAKEIAWDIVETLSAMANADGGELVIGVEDDGTITGIPHPADKLELFRDAPHSRNYVTPPLRYEIDEMRTNDGLLVLHFLVDWSPEVHQLADGRYLLRVGDANIPFAAERITALKATKGQGLIERSFPAGATLDDLDLDLIKRLWSDRSPEDVLRRYRLIEGRNGHSIPNLAALLLLGKDPMRWHPRCGVDFVRWNGTERRYGAELNVDKRFRIEAPLATLIEEVRNAIRPFIRERQQLHDLFFTERLEYPTFVWQEAIVNAVAHRSYAIQGASTEVWMFDERIEIRSPGLPPEPITIDALNQRKPLHLSRNPLLVHVLTDLGYMRELGEGIPRMFNEMEQQGFYPPRFESVGGMNFEVVLRNQPVYGRETMEWLRRFDAHDLSGDQKRLLAYAHAHSNRFTSREYQKLSGLDLYGASNSIKDLIRKSIVHALEKGGRIYEVPDAPQMEVGMPDEMEQLLPLLQAKASISNEDIRGALGVSRASATRVANELVRTDWLERQGTGRWTRYRRIDAHS